MKIDTLKQLEAVVKLCKKQGITDIKIDGIEMHLAPAPKTVRHTVQSSFPDLPTITPFTPGNVTEETDIVAEVTKIDTDELTNEQLLFCSSRPEEGDSAQGQQ